MPYAVGEKGQVVIEKGIRDALGVRPESVAVQTQVADHNRSLKGALAKYVQRSLAPEDWASVRERAWDEATAEDWKREGNPVEP